MNNRSIRIFLSSTFRDFGEERDLLVKRVFPSLRARLKDRFVELVDVDLRWGITVEEAERGEVLPICLAEIDRSRPYFIGMLGERYGWIPPHEGYALDLLERQPWLKKHQGGKSVTELEILHGVLKIKRMKSRAFFYFRSPAYARTKGGHYVPDSTEDRHRQLDLKRRIKESGYSVTGYRDPEALAKRMERDLWKLLDAEFPATDVPDAVEREKMLHEAYAAPRRRLYLGGERYQTALGQALDSGEQRIVIEGASGGGKSALIANFFEGYRKRHPKHHIHEHYLGASADAGDPHALVRRLCEFIKRQTGNNEEIPGDPQKLMDSLPIWLATASVWARKRRTRFIVVLDSLNSLTEQQDLRWWPEFLPRSVAMVVSCLQGPIQDALKQKTQALPGQDKPPKWKTVTVRPMTKAQSATLLNTFLARFNKKLPWPMVKQVQAHPLATNPLFLLTLAEELRLFGVHEELQKRLDHYLGSQTIGGLFQRVLERVEKDCGKKQVKAAMTAIWASRAGLTEKEILRIADLTPAAWAAVRLSLDDALTPADQGLIFSHDYLRSSVKDRYLLSTAAQKSTHRALGFWFSKHSEGIRRAFEEPFQWLQAAEYKKLQGSLINRSNFHHFINARPDDLSRYWRVLKFAYVEDQYQKIWANSGLNQINEEYKLVRFLRDFRFAIRPQGYVVQLSRLMVDACKSRFGISHSTTLMARSELGGLLAELKEEDAAKKELLSVLDDWSKRIGVTYERIRCWGVSTDPTNITQETYGDPFFMPSEAREICRTLFYLGRGFLMGWSSEWMLRRAFTISLEAASHSDLEVAAIRVELADVWDTQGLTGTGALELARLGYVTYKRALGRHPKTAEAATNFAYFVSVVRNDSKLAARLHEEGREIRAETLGKA